jgi:hypothetical protein
MCKQTWLFLFCSVSKVLGVVNVPGLPERFAGRGGFVLVSTLSGQSKSKSSVSDLRLASTGRFFGDTFVFT